MIRTIPYIAVSLIALATLFCVLSISTNRWYDTSTIQAGLWKICRAGVGVPTLCYNSSTHTPTVLALSGLILIFIGLILTIVSSLYNLEQVKQKRNISYTAIIVLFIGSIILDITYVSYSNIQRQFGYSYFLMVISHLFTFLAVILVAFSTGSIHQLSEINS
ncbi:unnamed protein product [Didymodactylos carnosus]|uniref:Uncharacterized protein n=1 Tax=Didymodactylos carnosus TaxID=1234261 RepID=A0A814P9X6_9BILA|nr:unnamed protein product [Didymodactylos carnosus]CAF3866737.1 unnamed protein product [Didymodactylos carnosus]